MIPQLPRYLTIQEIQDKITELETKYPILREIPIDCEEFAEIDLDIELIPVAALRARVGADAFITRSFSSILIDNDYFNDPKMRPRNNFSIAHELGHLFLHRDYFESQCPGQSEEDWIKFMTQMDDISNNRLEWQADTFASMLLMPHDTYLAKIREPNVTMASLGRAFGVSDNAAYKRMTIEDIRSQI